MVADVVELHDFIEIREKGIDALIKELGMAGAIVFLRQSERGSGDYTREKYTINKDITIDRIVSDIENFKRNGRQFNL